jgi:hypothetical protein
MVVALVALVAAVAGTAVAGVARTSKLSTQDRKQVAKIANKAANKRISKRASKLSVAHASRADLAGNAESLGGAAASSFVAKADLAPVPEANLALHSGWMSIAGGVGAGPARGYRDQLGVVHLAGLIGRVSGSDNIAATLPSDLRPRYHLELPAVCDEPGAFFNPTPGILFIDQNGELRPITTTNSNCYERLSLDGITFSAGG